MKGFMAGEDIPSGSCLVIGPDDKAYKSLNADTYDNLQLIQSRVLAAFHSSDAEEQLTHLRTIEFLAFRAQASVNAAR